MVSAPKRLDPMIVLASGSLIILISMGLRACMGLFQIPITSEYGWMRESFAFAMAIQNLCWGLFQPFAGAIAERYGTPPVLLFGAITYALGLAGMAWSTEPGFFTFTAGMLIGIGQSGWGLAIILGAVARAMPAEKRSFALGLVTSAGAVGQLSLVPLGQSFLAHYSWHVVLIGMSLIALLAIPLSWTLGRASQAASVQQQNLGAALREAATHRGFWLLTAGFFVCGFHVAFIAIHLPAFLMDNGLNADTGAIALALIGGFNIIGCMIAGRLGNTGRKKHLLSGLYLARALVFIIFLILPITIWSVLVFSILIGLLWLSTVPLTSGLIGQIFGLHYMSTLFGIVFFGHQIGSFFGVWIGGFVFDRFGSYDIVWWAGVALGLISALLHWPINDKTIERQLAVA